jgi:phosphatidylglycerol lysyltransferase
MMPASLLLAAAWARTLSATVGPASPRGGLLTSLGPAVMTLGLLVAVAGTARRSRPVVAAAALAVLAGALNLILPRYPLALLLSLVVLAGAVGYEVGGALASRASIGPPEQPQELEGLRLLHGRTHISCFAGDAAKSGLSIGGGFIGYQVRWGVAVAVGDPVTAGSQHQRAVDAYVDLCSGRRWVPCFFQTDAELRAAYRRAGFRVLKFGEEAVVELDRFDLRTPARADARHEVARARRAGLEAITVWEPQPPGGLWSQLEEVSRDWLLVRGGREMGFSLGRLSERVDTTTRYTIARDQSGRVHAFCSWIRMGGDGVALDLIRRRPDAAAGAVDLCIVTAIERARSDGLTRISLGSVPFREGLGDAPDGRLARAARAHLYRRGCRGYCYRGLSHFKAKYATHWESRDVAVPRGPSCLLALAVLVRLHSGTRTVPVATPTPPPNAVPIGLGTAPLP